MPGMPAALSCQDSTGLNTCQRPKPMILTASRPTSENRAIGPQLVPWLTLTGVVGGRRTPNAAGLAGVADFAGLAPGLAPAAGLVDGRRLPPVCGLLMLIGPRRARVSVRVGAGRS